MAEGNEGGGGGGGGWSSWGGWISSAVSNIADVATEVVGAVAEDLTSGSLTTSAARTAVTTVVADESTISVSGSHGTDGWEGSDWNKDWDEDEDWDSDTEQGSKSSSEVSSCSSSVTHPTTTDTSSTKAAARSDAAIPVSGAAALAEVLRQASHRCSIESHPLQRQAVPESGGHTTADVASASASAPNSTSQPLDAEKGETAQEQRDIRSLFDPEPSSSASSTRVSANSEPQNDDEDPDLFLDIVDGSASILTSSAAAIGATLGSFWATSKVALDSSGVVDQTRELTASVSNKGLEALETVSRQTYVALRQPDELARTSSANTDGRTGSSSPSSFRAVTETETAENPYSYASLFHHSAASRHLQRLEELDDQLTAKVQSAHQQLCKQKKLALLSVLQSIDRIFVSEDDDADDALEVDSAAAEVNWRVFLGDQVNSERGNVILKSLDRLLGESRDTLQQQREEFVRTLGNHCDEDADPDTSSGSTGHLVDESVFEPVSSLACDHISQLANTCARLQCDHTVLLLAALEVLARWSLGADQTATLEYAADDGLATVSSQKLCILRAQQLMNMVNSASDDLDALCHEFLAAFRDISQQSKKALFLLDQRHKERLRELEAENAVSSLRVKSVVPQKASASAPMGLGFVQAVEKVDQAMSSATNAVHVDASQSFSSLRDGCCHLAAVVKSLLFEGCACVEHMAQPTVDEAPDHAPAQPAESCHDNESAHTESGSPASSLAAQNSSSDSDGCEPKNAHILEQQHIDAAAAAADEQADEQPDDAADEQEGGVNEVEPVTVGGVSSVPEQRAGEQRNAEGQSAADLASDSSDEDATNSQPLDSFEKTADSEANVTADSVTETADREVNETDCEVNVSADSVEEKPAQAVDEPESDAHKAGALVSASRESESTPAKNGDRTLSPPSAEGPATQSNKNKTASAARIDTPVKVSRRSQSSATATSTAAASSSSTATRGQPRDRSSQRSTGARTSRTASKPKKKPEPLTLGGATRAPSATKSRSAGSGASTNSRRKRAE
eukprot:CAMPEP_0177687978 /NCGR_PEP_ID=MMETSP0447-20121125/34419_1 /TAXON_ID=0 /ORGANISM="Stygamoeba regulata, Strain BSH-02190019" /LENGTH=1025 /DNA_ID=CAMNT_0019198261 /DNA_START=84 /DNA_END=3162 /DNA_ORIENTATION=+